MLNLNIPKIGSPFSTDGGKHVSRDWYLFLSGLVQVLGGPIVNPNISAIVPVDISLTSDITGVLGVVNGGTGISNVIANALLYAPTATTISSLNVSNNAILISNASGMPNWTSAIQSTSVNYVQAGPGALTRSAQNKMRDIVSLSDFAIGNGVAEQAAIQNGFNEALSLKAALYISDGKIFNVGTGVTVNGMVDLIGTGTLVTTTNTPVVTYNINTTPVNGWLINGPSFIGPTTTVSSSCAIHFIGDNTSFVQYGYVNCFSNGFNAFLKDEKTPVSTSFGLEGMLAWNTFDVRLLNGGSYGFWFTNGNGTGNRYLGQIVTLGAGAASIFVDGNGCIVGDIIAQGQWGCAGGGGIGVKIGDNTTYRAQIDLTAVQFDDGCNIPILMSSTGSVSYTNVTMIGNNYGGFSDLGAGLQTLRNSNIVDRDLSDWRAGNFKATNVTGVVPTNTFQLNLVTAGACNIKVYANGYRGGVGAGLGFGDYDISEVGGALAVTSNSTRNSGISTSVTTSGTTATVVVTCTPTSTGTYFNASIFSTGNDYKITRL